jgi:hypothetical protein
VDGRDPYRKKDIVMTLNALSSLGAIGLLTLLPTQLASHDPGIAPPRSSPFGQDYAAWSANWWQWFMGHPVARHPAIDDPSFDVTSGQSGNVWFLATPVEFGTATPTPRTRHITIHAGTALFVGMINGEMSSLEGAATEGEQRDVANFQADRIVNLAGSLDGRPLQHLANYRFESEQFAFTAPDPWIFSPAPSGAGSAVADGYYLFVQPLGVGTHVLHYSGGFHFEAGVFGPEPFDISADQTYVITVVP